MKAMIKIWNPSTGESIVDLNTLREMIAERRYNKLSRKGLAKEVQRKVDVMDTEVTDQPATSYRSFEIRQFSHQKAVEVFNAGGCQKASIINE